MSEIAGEFIVNHVVFCVMVRGNKYAAGSKSWRMSKRIHVALVSLRL